MEIKKGWVYRMVTPEYLFVGVSDRVGEDCRVMAVNGPNVHIRWLKDRTIHCYNYWTFTRCFILPEHQKVANILEKYDEI